MTALRTRPGASRLTIPPVDRWTVDRYRTELVGDLFAFGSGSTLFAIGWSVDGELERRSVPGYLDPDEARPGELPELRTWLDRYFGGDPVSFADYEGEVELRGTDFEVRVWHALMEIPHGETRSYADIAESVGSPKAVRAVGGANGRNPISILIPCHRVIGKDRTLTGFGGGLARKAALLDHEAPSLFR